MGAAALDGGVPGAASTHASERIHSQRVRVSSHREPCGRPRCASPSAPLPVARRLVPDTTPCVYSRTGGSLLLTESRGVGPFLQRGFGEGGHQPWDDVPHPHPRRLRSAREITAREHAHGGGKRMGVLDGRVALVTGAGRLRGIGRATAVALAELGADVVVTGTGRDPSTFPDDEKTIGW
jgi:hypothetical protein